MEKTKNIRMVGVELGERSYEIAIAPGLMAEAGKRLAAVAANRRCLIITDDTVRRHYAAKVGDALAGAGAKFAVASFPAGEANKTLATVERLYQACVDARLDRRSLIVALGGGVPGDIAGFVAATFMRGLDFIQIPTTLLAMVDSSVGGKTGVDLPSGKNLVGAFWQPKFVMIDPECLATLPEREVRCGLAEVVKYAIILDHEFFDLLEENAGRLTRLDGDFYADVISHCCRLKARVVVADEREGGLRAILNFGHTFAHAFETEAGYQSLSHGEAVAIGMRCAADLAVALGIMPETQAERCGRLMDTLRLPAGLPGVEPEKILELMRNDKKTLDGDIRLVLPEGIGRVDVRGKVSDAMVLEVIRSRCHG